MPLTGAASEVPPRKVDPAILKTDRLVTKTFTKNTFGCVRLFLIPLSHCHDLPDDCFFFSDCSGCFSSTVRANSKYLSTRGCQENIET